LASSTRGNNATFGSVGAARPFKLASKSSSVWLAKGNTVVRRSYVSEGTQATSGRADSTASSTTETFPMRSYKVYHLSHIALATLIPASVILSPSILSFPVDLALAGMIPIHSYYGMTQVVHDYVPKSMHTLVLLLIAIICLLMCLGLLRVTNSGPGITATIKYLWMQKGTLKEKK